ncbi:phage tail spike protein, partial [Bifidobacterium biavatii]
MRFRLLDRWGNPLGDLENVIRADRTQSVDGTDTLDITTTSTINKDERILIQDGMGRWLEYICTSSDVSRSEGNPAITTAYCSNSIIELSRSYIAKTRNRDSNSVGCATNALDGTRWKVGRVEQGSLLHIANISMFRMSSLEALQETCKTFGLEIETQIELSQDGSTVATRTVNLYNQRGRTVTTKRFEYGKDLTKVTRTVDADDVVTRLYGWGKGIEKTDENGDTTGGYSRKITFADINDGKEYVEDDSLIAQWGIVGPDGTKQHAVGQIQFADCEHPEELLRLTKEAFKTRSQPVLSYTADVIALAKAGYDVEGTDLGDSVQIVDTTFTPALRVEGRVTKIEEDLVGGVADMKLTLGNITSSFTQRQAAQEQALDKMIANSSTWDDAATGTENYMHDLIDRVNEILNENGGYTYLVPGQGIYVYDKPRDQNPTQVIQIGGGYWRIASSKKANGDWDFRNLASGKGIFANVLFTGRISDAAGRNWWDLDTGEFRLSSTTQLDAGTLADLASKDYAANLQTEAKNWAKEYANQVGADTLGSAKADATQKAGQALTDAKADATSKAEQALSDAKANAAAGDKSTWDSAQKDATAKADQAEANANKHSDENDAKTLTSSKSYSDTVAEKTLAAAKAFATDQSKSQVDTLEKELTQTYIFNKLTNNGQAQGIALAGGLLYINATYIDTGIIKGGKSYWNLDTGKLYLEDGEFISATITGSTLNGDVINGATVNTPKIVGASEGSTFISNDGNSWLKFGQFTSIRNEI